MEYCGTTLRRVIDKGLPDNESRAWELFKQILDGVAYIHDLKIIHRDLNPKNIFVDNIDNVKIGDFGLATTGNNNQNLIKVFLFLDLNPPRRVHRSFTKIFYCRV